MNEIVIAFFFLRWYNKVRFFAEKREELFNEIQSIARAAGHRFGSCRPFTEEKSTSFKRLCAYGRDDCL
ncbi:MAG: hypothetical protein C4520_01745 [Candidatus Abyssobacteria bacterium SURF_5]|uniref:Uncharacterized protein n=1 Tax=Abyssobacteria bacterium (strain SURF_5) TaxID=2093360 RepID=A0A3A4P425_ABYX5|nr:MAG: hypothetical protein C4520_01745 [Candidatus Abyssubacteria bacterium SURF_5]